MTINFTLLGSFLVNGLIVGILYGTVAMSFVLIYKASKVVNFAQGEFLLLGAWICWMLTTQYGMPFYLSFLATLIFTGLMGVLLQAVILRPLIGEPLISMIMVTVGMSVLLQAILKWIFGVHVASFPPLSGAGTIRIGAMDVETVYLYSSAIALFSLVCFWAFFTYSKLGLAMRATAFNQQVAQSLGVPVQHIFAVAWAISGVISAVAGITIGLVNGVSSGIAAYGLKVFPAVILGGLDSVFGAVVGGILIGILENLSEFVDGQYLHIGNLYNVVPLYVIVVVLMIKPYGLFGTKDIERI